MYDARRCIYPGEAGFTPYNISGHWVINDWNSTTNDSTIFCVIVTKSKVIRLENEEDFTLLWNPVHVARLKWVPWEMDHITRNIDFPAGVVQSDKVSWCNLRIGRHMGTNLRLIGRRHLE